MQREGEPREVTVRPRPDERGEGRIGVSQQYVYRTHGPGQALVQSVAHTGTVVAEGTRTLTGLLQGRRTMADANPVGMVKQSSGAAGSGLGSFLRVMVSLSVALADLRQHIRRTRTAAAMAPPGAGPSSPAAASLPTPAASDGGLPLRADGLGE